MSDMPRPGPLPPATEHSDHDALLVAQFVAGDPLDGDQQRQAQMLVSSCRDCDALAADLRAVTAAVAWEPVPPRRRDFRIVPEQAERLQGNAFSRLLRRLSLPRARALQPVAAGAMSLGLALVVVGYAWPQDGTIRVDGEPLAAPAVIEERAGYRPDATDAIVDPAPVEIEAPVADPSAPTDPSVDLAPVTVQEERAAGLEFFADESEASASTPASAADDLAASRLSDGVAKKASRSQAVEQPELESLDRLESLDELESVAGAAADGFDAEAAPEGVAEEKSEPEGAAQRDAPKPAAARPDAAQENAAVPTAPEAIADDPDAPGVGAVEADGGTGLKELTVAADAVIGEASDVVADTDATAVLPVDSGVDLEDLLIVVGFGLAVAGGLLLILAWLVRRTRDPLLR